MTINSAIEAEEELNKGGEGASILKSEPVKVIKHRRRRNVTGYDNIPVDLLKELGDNAFLNNDCTG